MSILKINGNKIIYSGTSDKLGRAIKCNPFEIKISDLKYIVLSPRLSLDEEECFLVLVDINFKLFPVPFFQTEHINFTDNYFNVNSIRVFYSNEFSYESHYGKTDKIIYPKELIWKDLFYKDWKLFVRGLYSWIWAKSFFGNIIDYDK